MARNYSENTFLSVGYKSAQPNGSLKMIEVIGVPGQKKNNGEYFVSDKARQFFDDTIVRKIFSESRRIQTCNFEFLKIWLDGPDIRNATEYDIPEVKCPPDYEIPSDVSSSRLKSIYILLDNKITGHKGEQWRKTVDRIFSPLFKEFISPPDLSEALTNNPLGILMKSIGDLRDSVFSSVDHYAEMKKTLFFSKSIMTN